MDPRRAAARSGRRRSRGDHRRKTIRPLRFWDSSAVYPLLAVEASSAQARALLEEDSAIVAWWGTQLECASAISRREREGTVGDVVAAFDRLDALASAWTEIEPSEQLRRSARRLLRVHPLRAADAVQLAAALTAAETHPASLAFVTLDRRLGDAARREGFPVLEPGG